MFEDISRWRRKRRQRNGVPLPQEYVRQSHWQDLGFRFNDGNGKQVVDHRTKTQINFPIMVVETSASH